MNALRHRARSERGAELVEFALVFPLLLLLVLGMVDFGFLFQRYEVLTNAAREGARLAVLPGYVNADVSARVRNYVSGGGVPTTPANPTVAVDNYTITTAPGGPTVPGKRVIVTYTNSYLFLGPIAAMFGGNFSTRSITAVAIMRTEIPTP